MSWGFGEASRSACEARGFSMLLDYTATNENEPDICHNFEVRYMSQFEVRYMSQFEVRYMSQAHEKEGRMIP